MSVNRVNLFTHRFIMFTCCPYRGLSAGSTCSLTGSSCSPAARTGGCLQGQPVHSPVHHVHLLRVQRLVCRVNMFTHRFIMFTCCAYRGLPAVNMFAHRFIMFTCCPQRGLSAGSTCSLTGSSCSPAARTEACLSGQHVCSPTGCPAEMPRTSEPPQAPPAARQCRLKQLVFHLVFHLVVLRCEMANPVSTKPLPLSGSA